MLSCSVPTAYTAASSTRCIAGRNQYPRLCPTITLDDLQALASGYGYKTNCECADVATANAVIKLQFIPLNIS